MKILAMNLCKPVRAVPGLVAAVLVGCGGSGGGGPISEEDEPSPPPPTVIDLGVTLSAADVVGGSDETGSGTAEVSYNETDGELEVAVALTDVTADSVSLNSAYAGSNGEVRYSLEPGGSAGEWQLAPTPLTEDDVADLEAGALYLEATTPDNPAGALRGQILPSGIELARVELTPEQVTSSASSAGSGMAWATVDTGSKEITMHVVIAELDDATGTEIRQAKAGDDGPLLASLAQDTADASHWLLETTAITEEMETAGDAGELYLTVTTPAAANGAIRGQWLPDSMELIVTELDDETVVMSKPDIAAKVGAALAGRVMTTLEDGAFTSHANLFSIGDADAVELRRAPAGQNGPVVANYEQSIDVPGRWSLVDVAIDAPLQANFDNRTLYVNVTAPTAPGGIARGQVITEASMAPGDDSAFLVESIDPPNAASLEALPANVVATLNRAPLPASVGPQAVRVEGSGQDGSFGDGNEVVIVPASVTADGNAVTISLAGVQAADDVYRVLLFGDDDGIVDMNGIPLDGDADGAPGGNFESAFELATPEVTATFSEIQETIFTPTCATSGCHSGSNPPDGLNLTAGQAYSNIVNVSSVQMPSLFRIEPGNPDDSYLVRKVEGTGIVANRMPLDGDPLSAEQVELLRQWVEDGAEDN